MISKREYQVAELIAWGASDKEVAQELFISELTARTHRRNILEKIRGHNGADITRWFFQKKAKVSFGLNPRQIRHLAFFFLLLVGIDEFIDSEMLRARRIKLRRAKTETRAPMRARVKGRTFKRFELEMAS